MTYTVLRIVTYVLGIVGSALLPRYIRTNETRSMTACCQARLAKPVSPKKFIIASSTLLPQICY